MTLRVFFILFACFSWCLTISAQDSYQKDLLAYRKSHQIDLIKGDRAPLLKSDLKHLRYFDIDSNYKVRAVYFPNPEAPVKSLDRVNGQKDNFIEIGEVCFRILDHKSCLKVYRFEDQKSGKNYIFLGFRDSTNESLTYGGGRYLEVEEEELENRIFYLDFNKAYNPYCAYTTGYRCIVVPMVNTLNFEVSAGEKRFGKSINHH